MCGICGQLRFDNQPVLKQTLSLMNEKIRRRGPDDDGIFIDEKTKQLGFGHRRLSIIDLSNNAHQPMVDKVLGLSLVFNGTIYNYLELQKELKQKGYKFFSNSDTEVILKAYHAWGEKCLERFDGMFAFAIWNGKELFIARDRMGIKPLYYTLDNSSFSFASNTAALLTNSEVDTSINPKALNLQLSFHGVVPAPDTILNGVKKFKPAHFMVIKNGKITEKCYWSPTAKRTKLSEQENLEKTEELLIKAVEKRMGASDVDIGVLLSGGLDSSMIVGLLDKLGHKNINTFSIGFEDIGKEVGSEFEYSDAVVSMFNTNHQKIIIPNSDVLKRLPEAVANMAEPMVAQDAVAFYLLSEQVSKKMKVVLSGQGADEAFCGYFWYPKMANESGDEIERFAKHYIDRPFEEYKNTIDNKYLGGDFAREFLSEEFNHDNADEFIDKVLLFDITKLIVDDPVKRVDSMTMSFGLEARVPFMDYKLVEHALSMSFSLKANKAQEITKYPLQKVARGLVPDSVIDRKKGYFPMPALKYVRGEFLDFMVDVLKSSKAINRGLYNQKMIDKIIKNPDDYMTALRGSRLWHLALLEFWLQTNNI
jgi:asparagine synthase (glutamine-hydrolysing)